MVWAYITTGWTKGRLDRGNRCGAGVRRCRHEASRYTYCDVPPRAYPVSYLQAPAASPHGSCAVVSGRVLVLKIKKIFHHGFQDLDPYEFHSFLILILNSLKIQKIIQKI